MNRPYLSESAVTYNENLFNTVPARFGNNNILVNQGQHKKVINSTSTSIIGQPQQAQFSWNPTVNQWNYQQPTQIIPQRHVVPQGVTYTFQPAVQNYALRNFTDPNTLNANENLNNAFYQQPSTLQQQIALNQLQKHALEAMLLHEQFKENPFKLQFHKDGQTNTDELLCKFANICNCQKTILNPLQTDPQFEVGQPGKVPEQLFPETNRKQLMITPEPDIPFQDKGIQFSPSQETVEVQTNTIRNCQCKPKHYLTKDNQTETKKVTFDSDYTSQKKRRFRHKSGAAPRHRHVDEDSSDSSIDNSSSSKSSEESN